MLEISQVIGVQSIGRLSAEPHGPLPFELDAHEFSDGRETDLAEETRRVIREKLTAELRAEADHMRERGRFRFENAWLTHAEILALIRARHRKSWFQLLELIGLLLALCGVAFVLYKLLFLLA